MKSGGPHVSTSCYLNPGLLYTMHTLRFHMFLIHDQQNPLTTSNYILHAPKPERNKERERDNSNKISGRPDSAPTAAVMLVTPPLTPQARSPTPPAHLLDEVNELTLIILA